jgi:glycosyltransferase involved in cell wall biosynthesis
LEEDVALPGFVENPYAYLARAQVFALSSIFEGLPTVLIEALALGTPVVATDCRTGPREILDDGRLGRLVPMGQPEALAAAIAETLDRPPAPVPAEDLAAYRQADAADSYIRLFERVIEARRRD